MKRLSLSIILLIVAFNANANTIDRRLQALMDDLAKKYLLTQETLVSKKTVTLVEMKNVSPLAAENFVGQALSERIKAAIQDSLVFTYVDRELLEEALEEIELSLSDFTEGSTVEVGRIEEVELLLSGSVLEEGEDFLVTLQLVDVQTTTLVAISKTRFAKAQLIEAGSQYAFTYITANGIGTSLNLTPAWFMILPVQKMVKHADDKYHSTGFGAKFTYRLSRSWKVSLDFSAEGHYVFYDSPTYGSMANIPTGVDGAVDRADNMDYMQSDGTIVPAGSLSAAQISNFTIHYAVQQIPLSFSLPFSYVFSIGHKLNVSAGIGPSIQAIEYIQSYDNLPVMVGNIFAQRRKEIQMWFMGVGAVANLELEYFILPRFALNVGLSWQQIFTLPQSERQATSVDSGEYYYARDNVSYEAFGLDPFMLTNGDELDHTLFNASYGKIYAGISIYF
jgi:TolB-like protein